MLENTTLRDPLFLGAATSPSSVPCLSPTMDDACVDFARCALSCGRYLLCGAESVPCPRRWWRPSTVTAHLWAVRLCALVYFFAFFGIVMDGPIMWAVMPPEGGWTAEERLSWCRLGMLLAAVACVAPRMWPALALCWPIWHKSHTGGGRWFGFGWDPMLDDVGFLAVLLAIILTLYDDLLEEPHAMQLEGSICAEAASDEEAEAMIDHNDKEMEHKKNTEGSAQKVLRVRRKAENEEGQRQDGGSAKESAGSDGVGPVAGKWQLCNPFVSWGVVTVEIALTLSALRLFAVAGILKMQRGDSCWRDHTCLNSHFYTQPMPNPLAWYFNNWTPSSFKGLMQWFAIDIAECIAPYLLLGFLVSTGPVGIVHRILRRSDHLAVHLLVAFPARLVGSIVMGGLLFGMFVSGNYAFLHPLSAVSLLASCGTARCVPVMMRSTGTACTWYRGIMPLVVIGLAIFAMLPSCNTLGWILAQKENVVGETVSGWGQSTMRWLNTKQVVQTARAMNLGMDHYMYAYFADMVETRNEWVFTAKIGDEWFEFDVPCKVGSVDRAPCITSPLHRRFAWQLWHPFGDYMFDFPRFFAMLCDGDDVALTAIEPGFVRDNHRNMTAVARQAFVYNFTTMSQSGWWTRRPYQRQAVIECREREELLSHSGERYPEDP
mmetsp:Transcript_90482/g.255419  ORF Transcript_90482/g.255419 Transcript_90482/m.255419 type:complete len:660 (+) Transcript_90482:30-2009(+)